MPFHLKHPAILLAFVAALVALADPVFSASSLQIPPLTDPVMDEARMISAQDQAQIREVILRFNQAGKGQIQVLTLPSLQGIPIEQASIEITDKWKLGQKKRDDGVLILVAAAEKAIRIEVGQGLEGTLPDIKAKQIIADSMIPTFRQKGPSQGILLGVYLVLKTIDPDFQVDENSMQPAQDQSRQGSLFDRFRGLFFLIFIVIMLLSNLFRPRRRTFWGGSGFGGWGGGGGSGGGWGGGGGGFSGGGASGNW